MEAVAAGRPVQLGYLLGTRRYQAVRPWFNEGERLVITARLIFREKELAVFDCDIKTGPSTLATARLTVFQPDGDAEIPGEQVRT